MTPMQTSILNNLLRLPLRRFTAHEREWLSLVSRKLRYMIIARKQSRALSAIGLRLLEGDPIADPGVPDDWEGLNVTPDPETKHEGGPGCTWPDGAEGTLNVPEVDAPIRTYGE